MTTMAHIAAGATSTNFGAPKPPHWKALTETLSRALGTVLIAMAGPPVFDATLPTRARLSPANRQP